jgi:hypothetical protein
MRRLVILVAIGGALALAGAAGAQIVPQRGIAGVTLGMSPQTVRSILGSPVKVRHRTNAFGAYTTYRYKGLIILFQGNRRVTGITTHSRKERTIAGIGVGSTESQVRAGVPGVRCRTDAGFRHCLLGRPLAGHRVTDFIFKKGVVGRVVVGFVID